MDNCFISKQSCSKSTYFHFPPFLENVITLFIDEFLDNQEKPFWIMASLLIHNDG